MAYKYTGDSIINASLTVRVPKPLDSRTVVRNINDLYTIPAKYAYEGMTVANVDNGNIYMLTNKAKIAERAGWKASYESIQIIACSLEEYKEWSNNTDQEFNPVDLSKEYIHRDTYYYIYEESIPEQDPENPVDGLTKDLYYLKASWGKTIEELLSKKASNTGLSNLRDAVTEIQTTMATSELVAQTYVPLTFITGYTGNLSNILQSYYTSEQVDNIFVTKESLKGGLEGDDDFVFVTQAIYQADLTALGTYKSQVQQELNNTLKTNGDGSLTSITVGTIKSPVVDEQQLVINVTPDGLYNGTDKFANISDLPKLVTLTKEEYNALETVDEDTYYYITDIEETYVKTSDLTQYTTTIMSLVAGKYYQQSLIDAKLTLLSSDKDAKITEVNNKFENYYTKTESDEKYATITGLTTTLGDYVTKEMLGGSEGEDGDYIFVTNTTYQANRTADATALATALSSKVDTNSDATLKNVTAEQINVPKIANGSDTVEIKDGLILVNNEVVAVISDIPNIVLMSKDDYDALETKNSDTYYYLYNTDETEALVTAKHLQDYYTKNQVNTITATMRNDISALKTRSEGIQLLEGNILLIDGLKFQLTPITE